jgi:hypothetical protein
VLAQLLALGRAPPEAQALDLLAEDGLTSDARQSLLQQLAPKLKGGRQATADETASILAVGPRAPGYTNATVTVRIVDDTLAVLTESTLSRGHETLFRKVDGEWKRVAEVASWVH